MNILSNWTHRTDFVRAEKLLISYSICTREETTLWIGIMHPLNPFMNYLIHDSPLEQVN